jgi:hypothetical protein
MTRNLGSSVLRIWGLVTRGSCGAQCAERQLLLCRLCNNEAVNKRTVAGLLGATRLSFGMALLFSPAPTLRFFWSDEEASQQIASEIARALGIREVVLGVGILGALMRKNSPKPWLLASAAVDSADVALTLMNYFSYLRRARLATFVAGPATIPLDLYLAFTLEK